MTSRQDFTTPEWQSLQTAIMATIYYLTFGKKGFFDDIEDKLISHKTLNQYSNQTQSLFIKDLVNLTDYKWSIPKYGRQNADTLEPTVLKSIADSLSIINQHDKTVIPDFKNLLLTLAYNIASNNSASPEENKLYIKVALALENTAQTTTEV